MAPASMSSTLLAFTITSTPCSKKACSGSLAPFQDHHQHRDPAPAKVWPRPHEPGPHSHLEELSHLSHVAGTSAFSGIRHIFTNLQSIQQRGGRERTRGGSSLRPWAPLPGGWWALSGGVSR